MMDISMDYRVLGGVATNCYLLKNNTDRQCVLIDPADSHDKIKEMIAQSGCTLKGILLTHGHYDHMLAAAAVRENYHVPLCAGEAEKALLADAAWNLSGAMGGKPVTLDAERWLTDGEMLAIAGLQIQVIATPGHTPGGVSYYVPEGSMLFSGDTLFAESVGRTDFPGGSMSALVHSVKEKLFVLPEDTKVFPGHGEQTTIAYEKKYNPYCC